MDATNKWLSGYVHLCTYRTSNVTALPTVAINVWFDDGDMNKLNQFIGFVF
jgi:hypothetical protein